MKYIRSTVVYNPFHWKGGQWSLVIFMTIFLVVWLVNTMHYYLRKRWGLGWYRRSLTDTWLDKASYLKRFTVSPWRWATLFISVIFAFSGIYSAAASASSREIAQRFHQSKFVQSLKPDDATAYTSHSGEVTTSKFGCKATFVVKNNKIVGPGVAQVKVRVGQDGKLTCTHEELDAPQQTSSD